MRKLSDADFAFYAEILSELSFKEVKVVSLYCSGCHRNKIALILNISINTVKSHLSNAMEKLNADNTSELNKSVSAIRSMAENDVVMLHTG